jgi:hypothetical protein
MNSFDLMWGIGLVIRKFDLSPIAMPHNFNMVHGISIHFVFGSGTGPSNQVARGLM